MPRIQALAPLAVGLLVVLVGTGTVVARTAGEANAVVAVPSATPAPPTKAEFIARAEAICVEMNKETINEEWDSLREGADEIARFHHAGLSGFDRMLALEPPRDDRELLERIYYSFLRGIRVDFDSFFGRMEVAVRDGDFAAMERIVAEADDADPQEYEDRAEEFRAYGFTDCMRADDPADPAPPAFGPAPALPSGPQPTISFLQPMPAPTSAGVYIPPPTPAPTPAPLLRIPPP